MNNNSSNNSSNTNYNSSNNNFNKYVNIPLKNIGSKINNEPVYDTTSSYDYENTSSSYSLFKKVLFWFAIVLLLAFFGFNIFTYLAEGTDFVAALVYPFTYVIALITGDTAKTTIKHTSQGTQAIASESSTFLQIFLKFITDLFTNSVAFVSNTSTSAIDYLQSNITKDKTQTVIPEKQSAIPEKKIINTTTNTQKQEEQEEQEEQKQEEQEEQEEDDTILNNERKVEARVQTVSNDIQKLIVKKEQNEPKPLQSDVQQHGYCYVGKINQTRYCAKVSSNNKCMSGDIFPTMAVCVNPNLKT